MIKSLDVEMYDNFLIGGAGFSDSEIDAKGLAFSEPFSFTYDLLKDNFSVIAEIQTYDVPEETFIKNSELNKDFLSELKNQIFSRPIPNYPVVDFDDNIIIGMVSDKNNTIPFTVYGNEAIIKLNGKNAPAPEFVKNLFNTQQSDSKIKKQHNGYKTLKEFSIE